MDSKYQYLFICLLLVRISLSVPVSTFWSRDDGPPALRAIKALQDTWYDPTTGLWDDMWWNSANCLTTIANFQSTNPSDYPFNDEAIEIYESTFNGGLAVAQPGIGKQPGTWLNSLYDDEGWWALAWIKVYDVTGNTTYLNAARDIYRDMKAGLNTTSCGGLVWLRDTNLLSSIENSLFLDVAAQLSLRSAASDSDEDYLTTALTQYSWFFDQSRLLNPENLIPDGLDPATCQPAGPLYTYNQGTIIGALVSLSLATTKSSNNNNAVYLDTATAVALASISHFSSSSGTGILTEACDPNCDTTASQFKGVLIRNLANLQRVKPNGEVRDFIFRNADSIWTQARGEGDRLGSDWRGPYRSAEVSAMCAGLDGLVAAQAIDKS